MVRQLICSGIGTDICFVLFSFFFPLRGVTEECSGEEGKNILIVPPWNMVNLRCQWETQEQIEVCNNKLNETQVEGRGSD